MGKLNDKQQQTWNALKGFDSVIDSYYKKKGNFAKYDRIQQRLRQPVVSMKPIRATRKGPGFTKDKWQNGVQELGQYLTARNRTIPNALDQIQEAVKKAGLGKITWGKMTVIYKYTYTRYHADIVLGADVLIKGKVGKNTIDYFYDNASSAEAAHRYAIFNGEKLAWSEFNIMKRFVK